MDSTDWSKWILATLAAVLAGAFFVLAFSPGLIFRPALAAVTPSKDAAKADRLADGSPASNVEASVSAEPVDSAELVDEPEAQPSASAAATVDLPASAELAGVPPAASANPFAGTNAPKPRPNPKPVVPTPGPPRPPTPRPPTPPTPRPPTPRPAPSPKPTAKSWNCSPPYVLTKDGTRRYKAECL